MAKTLIYAEGSTRSVKIGDTNTSLYLQIAQDNVNVDLTTAKSINVKVRNKDSFVKTIAITSDDIQSIPGVIQIPLNTTNIGGLPDGDYYFEVWITNADDQSDIYPDVGVAKFSIVNNVESGSTIYTSLTLQDFEDRFAEQYNKTEETYEAGQANMASFNQATADLKQAQTDLANGGYVKTVDMNAALADKTDSTVTATKADKSYVDTMLSSIAQGGPKGIYYSLSALQTAFPTGTDGTYLVFDSSSSDGAHSYIWDSSKNTWTDLGVYEAMELADSTVDPVKLTSNNHARYYPFSSDSNFSDTSYNNFFKEIKIYNADRSVNYCIAGVFRNNSGKWRIYVSILNSDGTVGTPVATWDSTSYFEPAGLDLISLKIASNASGRHVDVLVDWNALSTTASFGTGSHGNVLKIGSQAYSNNQYVSSYPFSNESVIADNSIQHTIFNANLIGADKTQQYCIGSFQKNISGSYKIIINKYAGGTIGDMVASWYRSSYTPSSSVETIKVEKNSDIADGFDIELEIDWSRMLDGSAFGTNNLQNILIFDKKTYSDVPQDGLLIPSKSMYAVNPQNGFKESAFFAGNWQKRTINDIEVMTSCIPSSGMFFGFHGTELSGKFYKDQAGIQLIVQIDQNDPVAVWIDDNNGITSIATGLSDTDHIAKIFADPYFGTSTDDKHSFFTFKGALNFIEFEQTTWPVWNNAVKTLISYGDSFTAGGGGTIANSYASYCADYLGLNSIRISQGGAGLVERTDREWIPNLQQIAFQASDGVYTKPQSGDIITINIGTNDTKSVVTDEVYTAAMRDFIAKLKLRHCNAPIFLMGDWVNKYTSDCQTIAEDTEGVYYVDITSWSYPKQDDLHPTDEGHKEIALYLAKAIRDTLKSKYVQISSSDNTSISANN